MDKVSLDSSLDRGRRRKAPVHVCKVKKEKGEKKKSGAVPWSDELWLGGTVPESWSSALHFNELQRVS